MKIINSINVQQVRAAGPPGQAQAQGARRARGEDRLLGAARQSERRQ